MHPNVVSAKVSTLTPDWHATADRFMALFATWHGHKIHVSQDRQAREANTEEPAWL